MKVSIGFYIGDSGDESKALFQRNCRENSGTLYSWLNDIARIHDTQSVAHDDVFR